ncbi:hypothetical protein SCP_1801610 [Sparassis crispa]|uniref:Uncharacterized protein n=1 Tax=Sparassis crispa TaxID=139825 RepID=A0A401H6S2_9APHY|nr:hypothetical protein SCP_1801610 [Sparassis crispa]GBE90137.1 hypothetical protein SCP_1801610 [Sparassis crispa]
MPQAELPYVAGKDTGRPKLVVEPGAFSVRSSYSAAPQSSFSARRSPTSPLTTRKTFAHGAGHLPSWDSVELSEFIRTTYESNSEARLSALVAGKRLTAHSILELDGIEEIASVTDNNLVLAKEMQSIAQDLRGILHSPVRSTRRSVTDIFFSMPVPLDSNVASPTVPDLGHDFETDGESEDMVSTDADDTDDGIGPFDFSDKEEAGEKENTTIVANNSKNVGGSSTIAEVSTVDPEGTPPDGGVAPMTQVASSGGEQTEDHTVRTPEDGEGAHAESTASRLDPMMPAPETVENLRTGDTGEEQADGVGEGASDATAASPLPPSSAEGAHLAPEQSMTTETSEPVEVEVKTSQEMEDESTQNVDNTEDVPNTPAARGDSEGTLNPSPSTQRSIISPTILVSMHGLNSNPSTPIAIKNPEQLPSVTTPTPDLEPTTDDSAPSQDPEPTSDAIAPTQGPEPTPNMSTSTHGPEMTVSGSPPSEGSGGNTNESTAMQYPGRSTSAAPSAQEPKTTSSASTTLQDLEQTRDTLIPQDLHETPGASISMHDDTAGSLTVPVATANGTGPEPSLGIASQSSGTLTTDNEEAASSEFATCSVSNCDPAQVVPQCATVISEGVVNAAAQSSEGEQLLRGSGRTETETSTELQKATGPAPPTQDGAVQPPTTSQENVETRDHLHHSAEVKETDGGKPSGPCCDSEALRALPAVALGRHDDQKLTRTVDLGRCGERHEDNLSQDIGSHGPHNHDDQSDECTANQQGDEERQNIQDTVTQQDPKDSGGGASLGVQTDDSQNHQSSELQDTNEESIRDTEEQSPSGESVRDSVEPEATEVRHRSSEPLENDHNHEEDNRLNQHQTIEEVNPTREQSHSRGDVHVAPEQLESGQSQLERLRPIETNSTQGHDSSLHINQSANQQENIPQNNGDEKNSTCADQPDDHADGEQVTSEHVQGCQSSGDENSGHGNSGGDGSPDSEQSNVIEVGGLRSQEMPGNVPSGLDNVAGDLGEVHSAQFPASGGGGSEDHQNVEQDNDSPNDNIECDQEGRDKSNPQSNADTDQGVGSIDNHADTGDSLPEPPLDIEHSVEDPVPSGESKMSPTVPAVGDGSDATIVGNDANDPPVSGSPSTSREHHDWEVFLVMSPSSTYPFKGYFSSVPLNQVIAQNTHKDTVLRIEALVSVPLRDVAATEQPQSMLAAERPDSNRCGTKGKERRDQNSKIAVLLESPIQKATFARSRDSWIRLEIDKGRLSSKNVEDPEGTRIDASEHEEIQVVDDGDYQVVSVEDYVDLSNLAIGRIILDDDHNNEDQGADMEGLGEVETTCFDDMPSLESEHSADKLKDSLENNPAIDHDDSDDD